MILYILHIYLYLIEWMLTETEGEREIQSLNSKQIVCSPEL